MLSKIAGHAKFVIRRRIVGFEIPDDPELEPPSAEYFLKRLQASNSYLEFGCGGSTVQAAKLRKRFVSVESDRYFLNAVRNKISPFNHSGQLIYTDIGVTTQWGYPLFKFQTSGRMKKWKSFPEAPWSYFTPANLPDLVLIDGRFRAACALRTIKELSGIDFEILVDDYSNRESYRVIEQFASLDRMVGRMAVFRPRKFSQSQLIDAIKLASADFR